MAQIPSKQNGYSRVAAPEPNFTLDIETPGMGDLLRPGVPVLLETQSVEESVAVSMGRRVRGVSPLPPFGTGTGP